jgi:hypothetical protein
MAGIDQFQSPNFQSPARYLTAPDALMGRHGNGGADSRPRILLSLVPGRRGAPSPRGAFRADKSNRFPPGVRPQLPTTHPLLAAFIWRVAFPPTRANELPRLRSRASHPLKTFLPFRNNSRDTRYSPFFFYLQWQLTCKDEIRAAARLNFFY